MAGSVGEPGSTWFQDEAALLEVARDQRRATPAPVIAGYEELREVRRGGQGVVYAAVQRSTKRRVAVKVLSAGALATPAQRRRFEREGEVAAGLHHAGIVPVYDCGVAPGGWPFIVMEFIEGRGLDEWLRERAVRGLADPRDAVAIFAGVCEAVGHAHQRGVIHRDIKPSNIRLDGSGVPRVLDFGLAKATAAESLAVTDSGQFLGSLPWASPEQVEGDGASVDVRSDVYSLGVVLFQMLTGALPYDTSSVSRAMQNIRSAEPAWPQGAKGLDQDVRTIVLKCLSKDPAGRYQTAGELLEDIRAWQAGEPIRARREGAWRALGRRARRYRAIAWVAGVGVVLVGVMAAWALRSAQVASAGKAEAERAGLEAKRERDAAVRARALSDSTVTFVMDLLGSASPDRAGGGRETRVIDLLDKAAREVPERYKDDPATLANLHDLLGNTYAKLEMWEPSDAQFAAILGLIAAHPEAFPDPATRLSALGNRASILGQSGRREEGIRAFAEVVGEYERLGITRHANLANSLSDMGVMSRQLNRLEDAERYYRMSMEATPIEDRDGVGYAVLISNRGMLMEALGKVEEGIPLMREALAISDRLQGPDSLQSINFRGNLAYLLITAGRPEEGASEMRRALDSSVRNAGESHTTSLILMNNLGKMLQDQGKYGEGLALYERAIGVYAASRAPNDPGVIPPMVNRIACLNELGRSDEALSSAEQLIETARTRSGEKSFDFCNAHQAKATTLERLGRLTEAEAFFRRAVELSGPEGGILPAGHWRHQQYLASLASNLLLQGRTDEAGAILPGAYDKLLAALGPRHPVVRKAAGQLAKLKRAQGDEAGAAAVESPAD
jgi:eukaryotic-like serine/threonine-protein kinase